MMAEMPADMLAETLTSQAFGSHPAWVGKYLLASILGVSLFEGGKKLLFFTRN